MLALHPGPHIGADAAASLAGLALVPARQLLAELASANLISEPTPGRHSFHDLLRDYARRLAHSHDADQSCRTATHRMLDHYLHTAHMAALRLRPYRDSIALAPPQPGVTPEHPADSRQALAWLTIEHPVLLAAVEHAADTGFDTHASQLVWTMWTLLDRQGHWHDMVTASHTALAAAVRLADPTAQASTHRFLGMAARRLGSNGDHQQAITICQHALRLFSDRSATDTSKPTRSPSSATPTTTAGNPSPAHDAWHHALTILDELDHSDANQLRVKFTTVLRVTSASAVRSLDRTIQKSSKHRRMPCGHSQASMGSKQSKKENMMRKIATLSLAVLLGVGGTVLVSTPASAVVRCSVSSGVTVVGKTVRGTNGADTINCSASTEFVTIFGNGGNDNITGTNDLVGDSLRGGAGNDRISGLFGDDTLLGEAGNDTLLGGGTTADDFCDGGTGTDTASGCAVQRNIP